MGTQVVFHCDHEGCDATYTLDSAYEHVCEGEGHKCDDSRTSNVPLDLSPVVRFLTDDPARSGRGWEFAINRMPPTPNARPGVPGLLLFHKCFCPKHGDDLQAMPQYKPDAVAKKHARRHH